MSLKKVLGGRSKLQKIHSQNFNCHFSLEDSYFVNLNIVNTSKAIFDGQNENLGNTERQKILELQKFRSSKVNKDISEQYLQTQLAQLSRRDRIPGNNYSTGSFTEITPILNKSITRVLIYGSPGTGKTTLCKKIVHEFYNTEMWNHLDEAIWIPLRQLKDSKFNDEQMDEKKLLETFLNEENLNINLDNILFILDGWDEIQDLLADPKKVKLAETLNKMKERKNLILTSRPYIQLNFAEYQRVLEITGFNDKNVRNYIKTFVKQNNHVSDQEKIMEYINNSVLSELVTIPIILEIFLFAWQEISIMEKNDITTTKLYETFILKLSKIFLGACGKAVSGDVSLKEVISGPLFREFKILREMGKKWLEDGSLHFVYKDFENTNGELEAKLPFLTTSCTGEVWKNERSEFIHLTFLEFFAAFDLINRQEEDFRQFVTENKFNPRYFVVFTFAAGLIHADLHNLKEYNELPYRYYKEEKLDLYFDYLQSDPVDLSGKYIYMLLVDCLHECKLSKSRESSIYQEIATVSANEDYYTGIDGEKILQSLRRIPSGLLNEYMKVVGVNIRSLSCYPQMLPQFTDEQVETIFKAQLYLTLPTKLNVLSKQNSFSSYSADVMLKLINFDCLRSNSEVFSNLPYKVLEKILKFLVNKDLFNNETDNNAFKRIKGISCRDTIKLCGQLVDVKEDDSIQDIIVKLTLSDVDKEILYFLEDVHEFVQEMPEAMVGILDHDNYKHDAEVSKKVLTMTRLFDLNSPALIKKLLQISSSDDKLKYHALRTIASIYSKKEIPTEVASHLLKNFKALLSSEKERIKIQNRLVHHYLVSVDRKSRFYFSRECHISTAKISMKEFVNSLKGCYFYDILNLIIDLFLGTPVSELPLECLRKDDRAVFKILPFIVETKTQDGNLNMKGAIRNIINSKEDSLREMVNLFELDLVNETIKEILDDITGGKRNPEWKWTMKRIFYTLSEIQRYNAKNCSQPKSAPKFGDEKCLYHSHILTKNAVLQEFFEDEDIELDTSIAVIAKDEENLFDTMMYLCYNQNLNDGNLLLDILLRCGMEDSEYQEKLTECLLDVFSQEIETEFRAEALEYLSERVHRMTKEQLKVLLKYAGDEKDYEFDENLKEDRNYLGYLESSSRTALISTYKFIKNCEYFSEQEETELRTVSSSYDKFCREESDLEIQKQIEELSSQLIDTMNKSNTKEIISIISDYLNHLDVNKCHLQLATINTELNGYSVERYRKVFNKFFPESYAKQFIIANFILEDGKTSEFPYLEKCQEKLRGKTFPLQTIENIYERFDDEVLGAHFLKVLVDNYDADIIFMIKSIRESSSKRQTLFMTYALVQRLIRLDENISVYISDNNLYMGESISDKPVISNLNENQRECLFNAKSLANSCGFNIQLCGITPKIEAFKNCVENCTVADLSDKEAVLKYEKHLDLSNQNIKETKEMEKIFNFVKKYPVETLILSNNQINAEMFEILLRNGNETHLKYLIIHNNLIDLEKFDFGKFLEDEDSYMKRNKSLLLLDLCNNSTPIAWLQHFEGSQDAEKFSRKDSEGNILVHGYNVNNTNIILYRSDLSKETINGKCEIM